MNALRKSLVTLAFTTCLAAPAMANCPAVCDPGYHCSFTKENCNGSFEKTIWCEPDNYNPCSNGGGSKTTPPPPLPGNPSCQNNIFLTVTNVSGGGTGLGGGQQVKLTGDDIGELYSNRGSTYVEDCTSQNGSMTVSQSAFCSWTDAQIGQNFLMTTGVARTFTDPKCNPANQGLATTANSECPGGQIVYVSYSYNGCR